MHLDKIWTTIACGKLGFLGFCRDQDGDNNPLKLWLTVFPSNTCARDWEPILTSVFSEIEFKGDGLDAVITLTLQRRLRKPEGLLKSLANQVAREHAMYFQETPFTCPCGHKEEDHYFGDEDCTMCDCPAFGVSTVEWETHTITNVGGTPGGFVVVE